MSILMIDKPRIERLYQFAKQNPVEVMQLPVEPIGDKKDYRLHLGEYRIVFSIEKQPKGLFKHLSVSLYPKKPGKIPHPQAVIELMKAFNFEETDLEKSTVWLEKERDAINVIEALKE